MPRYRHALPQLASELFLTDGGLETVLVYHEGMELPCFASFPLLETTEGAAVLRNYYADYIALGSRFGAGVALETPTWRANRDWGERLDYDAKRLAAVNRLAVELLDDLRPETGGALPLVISGCLGPRADGYVVTDAMSAEQAADYHRPQIETFAATEADMITALTLNYADEAIGVVRAARDAEMPAVISFTVETDGKLPTGQSLGEAIGQVDEATDGYAAYFMLNCAHPTHFADRLEPSEPWTERLRGLRANASKRSHAELDEASELDAGDPEELGREYAALRERLPHLTVLGGCCGTDRRHVEQIAAACRSA